jgi:hypothetical protein
LRNRRLSPEQLVAGLEPRGDIGLAHEYWYQGGYPEPWLTSDPEFRRQWAEQYLQTYLQRDVKALFPGLDPQRFRRFLEMLGGLSGRILNYSEIARALGVSQPTVRDYIDVAHGTFVWRTIPAYSRDTVKRIVKHPRGYVRDSGLLHRLLRIPDVDALLSLPQMGASWEGMVIEEILRRFAALGIPAATFNAARTVHQGVELGGAVDLVRDVSGPGAGDTITSWSQHALPFYDQSTPRSGMKMIHCFDASSTHMTIAGFTGWIISTAPGTSATTQVTAVWA